MWFMEWKKESDTKSQRTMETNDSIQRKERCKMAVTTL